MSKYFSFCVLLLLSAGNVLPSAKPLQFTIKIPTEGLVSPVVVGLKTDSTKSLLAVLVRSEKQDQIVLFDKHIQPFRRINVSKGIEVFGINQESLFYVLRSGQGAEEPSVCRLAFASEGVKCMKVPTAPSNLVIIGRHVYDVVRGSIHELDFEASSRRLRSYHSQLEGFMGPADADESRLIIANPLTGIVISCTQVNWQCSTLELLSPDQLGFRASKDKNEGFVRNVFLHANEIGVLAGRFNVLDGLLVNRFSSTGSYLRESRFALPRLNQIESDPRHKSIKKIMSYLDPTNSAVINKRLALIDKRSLTIVSYKID